MAARNKQINLLPQEEFDATIPGRVLKWAMSTFRIIVIVTELIVMAAFLSRFWLDAQNSDLNDKISIQAAEISAQSTLEKNFRNFQNRLSIFNDFNKQSGVSGILTKIINKVPQTIVLQSLQFQGSSVQIKGNAPGEIDISQFISNLKIEKSFKSVTLGQVSSSETGQSISFNVSVSY